MPLVGGRPLRHWFRSALGWDTGFARRGFVHGLGAFGGVGRRCWAACGEREGVRMNRSMVVLAVLALACGKNEEDTAGIQKDNRGCWLDGEQAWMAVSHYVCSDECSDEAASWTQEDYEDCMAYRRELAQEVRDVSCFDGCDVDACLDAAAAFQSSCSSEDEVLVKAYCGLEDDTPFFGSDHPTRTCNTQNMGW